MVTCPDCKGARTTPLFLSADDCRTCGGSGEVPDDPKPKPECQSELLSLLERGVLSVPSGLACMIPDKSTSALERQSEMLSHLHSLLPVPSGKLTALPSGHGFFSAPDRVTITSQPSSGLTFRVEDSSRRCSDFDKKPPIVSDHFVVRKTGPRRWQWNVNDPRADTDVFYRTEAAATQAAEKFREAIQAPLREQLTKVEAENVQLRKKLEKASTESYVRPTIDPDIVAFMERDLALIEESRKALREKALSLATGWLADKVESVGTIPDSAPVHYAVLADALAMLEQAGYAPLAFVCSYRDFADFRKMDTPHVRWEGKRAFIFGYEVFCTREFTGYFLAVAEGAVAVADVPR